MNDLNDIYGFTLIELIIVVTIVGIMGGVMLVLVNPRRVEDRTRDSMRITNLQKIAGVADSHHASNGVYPAEQDGRFESSYLSVWPEDEPVEGDVYTYEYDLDSNTYMIHVTGSGDSYLIYRSQLGRTMRCKELYDEDTCVRITGT